MNASRKITTVSLTREIYLTETMITKKYDSHCNDDGNNKDEKKTNIIFTPEMIITRSNCV